MIKISRFFPQLILAVSVFFSLASLTTAELGESEFRQLHKLLQPTPNTPWRTISWKISLLDAQHTAVKENKPIFIWAMDGHPLGCT